MDINKLRKRVLALSIYKDALNMPVVKELNELLFCGQDENEVINLCGQLCLAAANYGCINDISEAVSEAVLYMENPFAKRTSSGGSFDDIYLLVTKDLNTLKELSLITPEYIADNFKIDLVLLPLWKTKGLDTDINTLSEFHKKNGYGIYAKYKAFLWQGKILPIKNSDPVTLADLKGYKLQRDDVINNTKAFLESLPANNVLLYGDRGTGKSSTVHALLNEYYKSGLRIIEMPKRYIPDFPPLISILTEIPLKFIIFIDDLSFSSGDDTFASLKAVLEGGLIAKPDNVLIYATTNRRHLVRETFSDREGDEIHKADTMEEVLSLSDRFGITVTFLNPDRQAYIDIIDKLADDRELLTDRTLLHEQAERWALSKGGRSPRAAKQFIDYLTAAEKRTL